jgi:hypothetical protein
MPKGNPGKPRPSMYGNCNQRGGSRPNSRSKGQYHGFKELIDAGEIHPVKEMGAYVSKTAALNGGTMASTDDEVAAAIYLHNGNVTQAAKALGYAAQPFRERIRRIPMLKAAMDECLEHAVDAAMSVLWEAMQSEHVGIRLSAAKEFLRTEAAKRRGFTQRDSQVSINIAQVQPVEIAWLDDKEEEPKLIEGAAEDESGDAKLKPN